MQALRRNRLTTAVNLSLLLLPGFAAAQTAPTDTTAQAKTLDRVEVTGSRIKQTDKVTSQPVAIITRAQIDKSGATSIGEFLQQLTASGKALNTKFNSSGNFGYPPGGGGIGAGSSQVDLRNLGSQRVLVLVDGIRWVNESSASGVSGSADLNTIPLAIVDRIEVLEDGASAIYGSDAIAGVVNVITRKKYEGALVHTKYGSFGHGGDDKEADITVGGGNERFSGVFNASYVEIKGISSGAWGQSSFPVPGAGLSAASSGTPQGRFRFCDPRIASSDDPNNPATGSCADGSFLSISPSVAFPATGPIYDPLNPQPNPNCSGSNPSNPLGSYHHFSSCDRFNFAPFNLLLTPNKRKSLFASVNYDVNDSVQLHAKALYNNRESSNQAAPEPIFVGPDAGTGGIADTISISAANPFNPFGIDLCAVASPNCGVGSGNNVANFSFIGRRPLEIGPRIFTQSVETSYFGVGLTGTLHWGERGMDWNVDYAHSENKADQTFSNGFNIGKIKNALGPAYLDGAGVYQCGTPTAPIAGCVPLDLFGGQGRPMTQAMLNYISTGQHDSSKQVLDLLNANLTGDLWTMGDNRHAGFAIGYEHRRYQASFNPDPLRVTGESQDSAAIPISSSYDVNEAYGELQVPWARTFSTDFAVRFSKYSTIGSATTGKAGFRWQPIEDLVLRGTYSQGFRAPNIGELYGTGQFGPTVVDPCNYFGTSKATAGTAAYCAAAGVPAPSDPNNPDTAFQQANTQITSITGGNANLRPEKSDNYSLGAVYSPAWADNLSWSSKLDFEVDYFNYKIKGAIQAPDIQGRLTGCATGAITGAPCAIFTRSATGNLNAVQDKLSNFGTIRTNGIDLKANWLSPQWNWGQLSAALQATHTIGYTALDEFGVATQRKVGIEVDDSAIPSWQTNVQLGWKSGDWNANWNVRYISAVTESCDNVSNQAVATGCPQTATGQTHTLNSTVYNDVQLGWNHSLGIQGLKLSAGVNNLFGKDAPVCVTCTLNGYDAGTYDLPFRFWYISADFKF
jgi:iron complex outermembrane receptor protein